LSYEGIWHKDEAASESPVADLAASLEGLRVGDMSDDQLNSPAAAPPVAPAAAATTFPVERAFGEAAAAWKALGENTDHSRDSELAQEAEAAAARAQGAKEALNRQTVIGSVGLAPPQVAPGWGDFPTAALVGKWDPDTTARATFLLEQNNRLLPPSVDKEAALKRYAQIIKKNAAPRGGRRRRHKTPKRRRVRKSTFRRRRKH
jgi:hypothetical protein